MLLFRGRRQETDRKFLEKTEGKIDKASERNTFSNIARFWTSIFKVKLVNVQPAADNDK